MAALAAGYWEKRNEATSLVSSWRTPGPIARGPSVETDCSTRRAFAKPLPGVMGPGVRQDDDGTHLRTIASTPSLRAQRSNPEPFRHDGLDCFATLAIVDVH